MRMGIHGHTVQIQETTCTQDMKLLKLLSRTFTYSMHISCTSINTYVTVYSQENQDAKLFCTFTHSRT
jgi:hypothetical protein